MVKRLFDIVASLTALVLLSPVFLIAAVGIRLLDGGPILFRTGGSGGTANCSRCTNSARCTSNRGPPPA